ncbi:MAG: UbiD family decarboxylase [Methanomassiliicoccales archaeon]
MSLRRIISDLSDAVFVRNKVSTEFEVTKWLMKNPDKPVIFQNINGCEVVGNLWSTRERIARFLGIEKREIMKKLLAAIENPVSPVKIENPPFREKIIEKVDLRKLPIPKWFPNDGGRYITSAVAVAEYKGKRNLSFHRLMLIDRNRMAIRLVPRHLFTMYKSSIEENEELQVAFCIGVCPTILLSAATSVPFEQDELNIASSLRKTCTGEPLEVAETENGITVPAHSEIILEGKITRNTTEEGPFVDITGTYDQKRIQPVVEIERIYMSPHPLFHIILPGGLEHYLLMGLPREPLIYRSVSQVVPKVHGVRLTEGGCCWLHGVVSITKNREGDGVNAILAAFSGHPSMKKVIVVDEDIDIYNDREVEWAIATRFQASRGLVIINNAGGSSLDPSSSEVTSKMGIDATKPYRATGFERVKLD